MQVVDLSDFLVAWMTIFAGTLLVIGLVSWHRTSNRKLLMISSGFGLFFVKGLLFSVGIFVPSISPFVGSVYAILIDMVILLLFYLAIFRK